MYAVLQLEAEEKELQQSEAQVRLCGHLPAQLLTESCSAHLAGTAAVPPWVSLYHPHRSTQHSDSYPKGKRQQTRSLRGAGSRPKRRGRRRRVSPEELLRSWLSIVRKLLAKQT